MTSDNGSVESNASSPDSNIKVRIFLRDDTSYIRTSGPYGIYGNYSGDIAGYFFRSLCSSLEKQGVLASSPQTSDVKCNVSLLEINEADAEGLISWIFKSSWAASEIVCSREGRELKKRVDTRNARVYFWDNSVTRIFWRSKTVPVNSPLFDKTPVGTALANLVSQTDIYLLKAAEELIK